MLAPKTVLKHFPRAIAMLENRIATLELRLGFTPAPSPFGIAGIPQDDAAPTTPAPEAPATPKKEAPAAAVEESKGEAAASEPLDEALFRRIDLRVGKIVDVRDDPESKKAFYEKVDIGEPELRDIGKEGGVKQPRE